MKIALGARGGTGASTGVQASLPLVSAFAAPVTGTAHHQGTVVYVGSQCVSVQLQLGLTHCIEKMETLDHKGNYLGREMSMEAKEANAASMELPAVFPTVWKCVWGWSLGKTLELPTMLSNKIQPMKGSLMSSLGFQIGL